MPPRVGRDGRRILFAAEDRYASLTAVRALRAAGHSIWVATPNRRTYAARSRSSSGTVLVPDPAVDADGFVDDLAAVAEALDIDVVLPGGEPALFALAGRRDEFPSTVVVGTVDANVLEDATNKVSLLEHGRAAGLAVPRSFAGTREEVLSRRLDLPYPVMLKPLRSETPVRGGRLEYVTSDCVNSADELAERLERHPGRQWLLQEHVPGRLGAVAGVAWHGELICAIHQVASRTYPTAGPSAYASSIPRNPELQVNVASLIRQIAWSGVFQAQFIHGPSTSYLIDLNPRIYGSLALAVAAGYNLPAIWVDLLLGRSPAIGEYGVGVRYRAEERDARVLAAAVRGGRLREAAEVLVPRRGTVHTVFSARDPAPLLTTFGKAVGRIRDGKE